VVDIDFPNHQVAFRDPTAFKPPRGAIAVTLMRDGDTRLAPLSLNGGPPALFIMDTGFSDNLRIAPALAERQNLMAGQAGRPITIGAIGGDAKGVIGEIPSVELGGISFPNVSAIFSDTWPSATYTNRVDGLLGLGLLARFRVIVDWPHDRLFLIPSPATAPTRF
jgi:predicted aspartyl protease